ncbi:NnrS family protein [Candidatus Methylacidithermus pantelleriae]|uniref:NnrS protein involved in response to NO n=1 Tax=Candidatus Methylacidithermus pantelleriae TaxID=2744239 RepID=A0A8J2FTQ0_9BACT|nr:NnrS family protein [Candidatus Methylacidithermus pantelleriae]CAF0703082.1 NnrS protein involved in response to NO [Candidatus Methylacidithermus pantelleriae]
MTKDNRLDGTPPLPWNQWINLASKEPFRILFPLGIILGAAGVAVWPLFFLYGIVWAPPPISHPRILIEGFVGSFILGFLGTAMPRLLETPALSLWETGSIASALLTVGLFQFFGMPAWGDGLFATTLIFFLLRLASRFPSRRDNPPPSFLLVIFGILGAAAGAITLFLEEKGVISFPILYHLALLLLYQGLPLLPILGVIPFLLPRLSGMPNPEGHLEAGISAPFRGKLTQFTIATLLLLLASFLWEALGHPFAGGLLRVATVIAYLACVVRTPWQFLAGKKTTTSCAILALLLSIVGLFLSSSSVPFRIAWLHLFFLGGVSLLILTVGTRVILGHSGRVRLIAGRYPPLAQATAAVFGAVVFRLAADFVPSQRALLLSIASFLWLGALLRWTWDVLPKVQCPDLEA